MTISRGKILAGLLASAGIGYGQQPAAPKIVFVCEHGAAKSVIAAAEFRRLAKERGLHFDVISRGTVPDAEVDAGVRQGLKADGIDAGSGKPLKVSSKDLEGATRVVTFGPDLSPLLPRNKVALDWSAAPSPSKDYRAARDYILKQVEALLAELPR